jgi:hypothetical protein
MCKCVCVPFGPGVLICLHREMAVNYLQGNKR